MSHQWLRLWHDMPNDPKFRTVARASKQPVSLVVAVYVHLLVDASRNVTRGHVTVTAEDLASALDVTEDDIYAVLHAMEGRLMEGDYLSGWDKRQVKREDDGNPDTGAKSAAERKAEQRAREKEAEKSVVDELCHDESRGVTVEKRREDESKPITNADALVVTGKPETSICPHKKIIELYAQHLPEHPYPRIWEGQRQQNLAARWRWVLTAKKPDGAPYATDSESALSFFNRFFAYVAKSDFLTGRNGRWQGLDLGWLVKAENFAKVISGNYENKEPA